MTLDDDQAVINLDAEGEKQVFVTQHPLLTHVTMSMVMPHSRMTFRLRPKQARELAAALIAFAGDDT